MGAAPAGGAGGNTGADAGFVISEEEKKRKANESGYATDYQGNLNPPKKNKTKTKTKNQQNLAEHERIMRENRGGGADTDSKPIIVKEDVDETKQETTQEEIVEDEKKESEDKEYDARRTKRRGRRMTILTSPTGTDQGLVLGKPTLLGA